MNLSSSLFRLYLLNIFYSFINNKSILVEGIKNIDQIDINNANQLGYKIKLIGVSERSKNKITQRVHPALIKENSYIAKINGVLNAVIIDGNPVGQSIIQGEGAGPAATTSARALGRTQVKSSK